MAWFSQNNEAFVDTRPLTQERVIALFGKEGWNYSIDGDGDLFGRWGHTVFYFFLSGSQKEILNVSAHFLMPIPKENAEEARLFIEEWHRTRLWPKAYTLVDDEGQMRIAADVALDYEHGITDKQLARHARSAIGSTLQMLEDLMQALGMTWEEPAEN